MGFAINVVNPLGPKYFDAKVTLKNENRNDLVTITHTIMEEFIELTGADKTMLMTLIFC